MAATTSFACFREVNAQADVVHKLFAHYILDLVARFFLCDMDLAALTALALARERELRNVLESIALTSQPRTPPTKKTKKWHSSASDVSDVLSYSR